jgi:DNA repair ATPase RecN
VALQEYAFHGVPLQEPLADYEQILKRYDHAIRDAVEERLKASRRVDEIANDINALQELRDAWKRAAQVFEAAENPKRTGEALIVAGPITTGPVT